jgi:hypothetical protein
LAAPTQSRTKKRHPGDAALDNLYAVDDSKGAKAIRTRRKHDKKGRIHGGSGDLRVAARPHTSHKYRTSSILDQLKDPSQDVRPKKNPGVLRDGQPLFKPYKNNKETYEKSCTFGGQPTTQSCHSDFYSGFARSNSRLPDVRVFDKDMKDYKKLVFNLDGNRRSASPTKDEIAQKDNYSHLTTGMIVTVQTEGAVWDEEAPTRKGHIMAPHPVLEGKYGVQYHDNEEQDLEVPRSMIHIAFGKAKGPPILNWRRPEHLRAPITF